MGVRETGWVTYVETATRGSETSVAAIAGDPSIGVVDVSVFLLTDLQPTGTLDIGKALAPLVYTDAVVNADGKSGTITLADTLAAGIAAGTAVDVWAKRGPSTYYVATVLTATSELSAILPAHLIPHLEGGPRVDGLQEYVEIERQGSKWVVVDVTLQDPAVDGGYLHPDKPITPGAVTTSWAQHPDDFASTAKPEFLTDGTFAGNFRVQGAITSGGTGGLGTTSTRQQGFGTRKASGEPVTVYSNSDEQLDTHGGRIVATEAVLAGNTFLDQVVTVGQGTAIKFRSSTVPPNVSPTGDEDWPAVDGDFSGFLPSQRIGLAVVSPTEAYQLGINGTDVKVVGFNPTTGAALGVYTLSGGAAAVSRVSVTYSSLNDLLVTLGTDGTDWLVEYWAMPSAGVCVYDSQWTWTHGEHPRQPTGVMPTIGCMEDSGQERVTLAQTHREDGTVIYAQYLDGVFDAQNTTSALNLGDLAGVAVLSGNVRLVLASAQTKPGNPYRDSDGSVAMPLVTVATGASVVPALPVGESNPACAGISCLDGDTELNRVWYASRSSDRIIQHSNPSNVGFIWLKGAWGDSGSGGLTLPGPAVKLTKRPGTRIGVVLGALPRGVDSGLLYAGAGNTLPSNANWHAQNEPLVAGPVFVQIFNIGTSGSNPKLPGFEDFPTGADLPSTLTSEDDSVALDVASYSNAHDLGYRVALLEAGGGGGGGSGSGVSIHCGNATAAGISIHCGGAA